MQALLADVALVFLATAVPGPAKVVADPAELIAGIVLSNHVDAASLDGARVRDAALAGEPWRAAPGVFFSAEPADGKVAGDGVRLERLGQGWLWIRVCSLGEGALGAVRREIGETTAAEPVRGVILDLRAFEDYEAFEAGARLVAMFVPEGRSLFSLEGRGAPQRFTARESSRMLITPMAVIVDSGTRGVGEAIAESLRSLKRAVLFGSPTAGRAAEYGVAALPSGRRLRVPSRRVTWGDGGPAFHDPVRPDIGIAEVEGAEEMLRLEAEEGPAAFIAEDKPRPRQNEAALVRGENPELEEAIRLRLEASAKKGGETETDEAVSESDDTEPMVGDDEAPGGQAAAPKDEAKGDAIRDETLQRALDFLRGLDALGLNRAAVPAPPKGAETNAPTAETGAAAPRKPD